MKAMAIAIVACALSASSTSALANERENVSLKTNADAVNFTDAKSVSAFRRDMARQIAAICNPGDRLGADLAPDWHCRNEMAASLELTIRARVSNAQDRRLANIN